MIAEHTPAPLTRKSEPSPITSIGALFEALAEGWKEGSGRNRFLLAGEGGQFIRVPETGHPHIWYAKGEADIPIVTPGYGMVGFIRFESRDMFKGMFETGNSGDGVYFTAHLTKQGFEYAQVGVLDFEITHPDIKRCEFFNPPATSVVQDPALTHTKNAIEFRRLP